MDSEKWRTIKRILERKARKADSGRRIGAYRLLRLLGRGGMGVVFLAARNGEPETAN